MASKAALIRNASQFPPFLVRPPDIGMSEGLFCLFFTPAL